MISLWMVRILWFKLRVEGSMDVLEEFYTEDEPEQIQPEPKTNAKPKLNQREGFVQGIQQGLKQSVQSLN